MRRFAGLVELLTAQTDDAARLALLVQYLRDTPDPERGWGLALLTGTVAPKLTTPAMLRRLAADRIDPRLFALSQDFVGDLAETVALIWPEPAEPQPVALSVLLADLVALDRKQAPAALARWLDRLPVAERWALLRLAGGKLAGTIGGRTARQAMAMLAGRSMVEVEEIWHAVPPPYLALLAWAEGRGPAPRPAAHGYRPMPPLQPVARDGLDEFAVTDMAIEWCWEGRRVQLAQGAAGRALYDTAADEISAEAPALLEALPDGPVVLEGVLQSVADGPRLMLFDLLAEGDEDLRELPLAKRRLRLERWFARHGPVGMALSTLLDIADHDAAEALRAAPVAGARGLVLKPAAGRYRPDEADWRVWPRAEATVAAVVMYARPEGGGGMGAYADLTVGLWQDGALVPVGRVGAAGDAVLAAEFDAWVRAHTTAKHGPVREVAPLLVLRIAFDAVAPSRRHKAGLVLRRPRLAGIDERPPAEADRLNVLKGLLDKSAGPT